MKIGKIYDSVIMEVSDDVYGLVKSSYSNSRIIMTKNSNIVYNPTPNQEIRVKPKGL